VARSFLSPGHLALGPPLRFAGQRTPPLTKHRRLWYYIFDSWSIGKQNEAPKE